MTNLSFLSVVTVEPEEVVSTGMMDATFSLISSSRLAMGEVVMFFLCLVSLFKAKLRCIIRWNEV